MLYSIIQNTFKWMMEFITIKTRQMNSTLSSIKLCKKELKKDV